MPKTKKESLIFALIMCLFMCLTMSAYNMILHNGLSENTLILWLKSLLPTFMVAFIISYFIVNPFAKNLSFKLAKNKPQYIGLFISLFMVIGMVLLMGLYGTIMSGGINSHFIVNYLTTIAFCFIFALPLQLFIVGPVVRGIFSKIVSIKGVPTKNA